mmetsp:Transcript_41356/g.89573  ORF Transcript_41356/g.89573 Transcript_41356/m.89573 type:complete len:145 (+) Transcript_41356:400-834(+)
MTAGAKASVVKDEDEDEQLLRKIAEEEEKRDYELDYDEIVAIIRGLRPLGRGSQAKYVIAETQDGRIRSQHARLIVDAIPWEMEARAVAAALYPRLTDRENARRSFGHLFTDPNALDAFIDVSLSHVGSSWSCHRVEMHQTHAR